MQFHAASRYTIWKWICYSQAVHFLPPGNSKLWYRWRIAKLPAQGDRKRHKWFLFQTPDRGWCWSIALPRCCEHRASRVLWTQPKGTSAASWLGDIGQGFGVTQFSTPLHFIQVEKLKIKRTKPAIKGNANLTHVVAKEEYDNLRQHPLKSVARLP